MGQVKKNLQLAVWPASAGLLLAIVILQYQQLEKLRLVQPLQIDKPILISQVMSAPEAIRHAAPAVVSITATSVHVEGFEQPSQDQITLFLGERASLGSGVIVRADGFILTNLHVVESLRNIFDTVVTLEDGRSSPAKVVAYDETADLAILHINMDDLTPIEFGDEQQLQVGDEVFAIGFPRNIGQSVTQGIVSAFDRNPNSDAFLIQTDAAINPGNSGGALIDTNGRLVGINSSIFSESGRFEGIGFATPVSKVIAVLDDLISKVIEDNSGYLGVLTGEALDERTSTLFFGVPGIRGMLVENVDEGGPAERAGILPGDVISRVDATQVLDEETIILEFQSRHPGDHVVIEVYRDGQYIEVPTILGFGQSMVISP